MKKTKSSGGLPKHEIERIKEIIPTLSELRIIDLMRDYRAVRNAYFGNAIPPVEEVLIRFLPRREMKRLGGSDEEDVDGLCAHGEYKGCATVKTILLADDLRVSEIGITLRHEMAHMKVNTKFNRKMGEGKYWKKEIRRLFVAGAYEGLL
jgi:hypothetical protein